DNFQALNLLQERYREQVKCIYIDPPYNTDAGPISYKNGYRSSSWAALMDGRIKQGRKLLRTDGVLVATIDDYQNKELNFIIEENFGKGNVVGTVVIRMNPSGRPLPQGFAQSHEYAIFVRRSSQSVIKSLPRSEKQNERYKYRDEDGKMYMWELFRKRGSNSERKDRPSLYYPIYIADEEMRVPAMEYDEEQKTWVIQDQPRKNEIVVYPIDDSGVHRTWRGRPDALRIKPSNYRYKIENGVVTIYYKFRPDSEGVLPLTNWIDAKYSATEHGTGYLKKFFSEYNVFSYPKSIYAVEDCLRVSGADENAFVLDYFAGSGTTAHAVINLNREDNGRRKYILVEQGEYFDTVLKPRIQKVVYSADWKNGKATAHETGISHAFKVLKIESYEDALNNLQLKRDDAQQTLFDTLPQETKDDYLLRYMLEIESRGSLLSVTHFNKPFDCRLKVAVDSAGAYEERTIDLVETFNYLIGLRVKHIDMHLNKGFVTVAGWLPSGEKTLVLWRDVERVDYDQLNRLCDKLAINPADSEFEVVYINGDHNIPAVFTSSEAEGGITKTLKIRQIEAEFLNRMFAVDDV
ncbi:MAG: site-specific DNA-methyltransferase, partial [Nitrosomonas sp.]|nr:site-specific DNA-methyltransferase [Nitrosomonas sp.]